MPGMMDTVLNLGLNDETVEALAKKSGDKRFAYDSYRRFITMYSDVVLGIEHHRSRRSSTTTRTATAIRSTPISPPTTGSQLVARYKERVEEEQRRAVPAGPARRSCGARSAPCSARG